jgi:hypothetical protein
VNTADVSARAKIRSALLQYGRDLILEVKDTAPVYDTATATVTVSAAAQVTVRGRLYRKRKQRRTEGASESSEVWVDTQMAVLEARELSSAPTAGDYLLEDSIRWAIVAVKPIQGAEVVLTYEMELGQA